MSDIKLTSALPKGDACGLGPILGDLVEAPKDMHVALAIIDCKKTTLDADTGEVVPTIRIRRIEAIPPEDHASAHRLMQRALERRTGKTVLPLTLEDDIREAFRTDESGDGGAGPAA